MVTLTVKNIGNEPQSMFSSNQKAFSSTGNQYATDEPASLYSNNDQSL
jgi:hypothetical protein